MSMAEYTHIIIPINVVRTRAVPNGFIITMMPIIKTNNDVTRENNHVSSLNFFNWMASANLKADDIISQIPKPTVKILASDNGLVMMKIPAIILKIP